MASDIRFKHPFTCIIGGPTGSGKSSFCIRFLQNLDTLCTEPDFPGELSGASVNRGQCRNKSWQR